MTQMNTGDSPYIPDIFGSLLPCETNVLVIFLGDLVERGASDQTARNDMR